MLESILPMRRPIRDVLENNSRGELVPHNEFWAKSTEIIQILKPLYLITEKMGADKVTTLSSVYPILINLVSNTLFTDNRENNIGTKIKAAIKNGIEKRFVDEDTQLLMQITCVLDPRFSSLPFLRQSAQKEAKKAVSTF
jgi:hypothetical protein